MLLSAVAIFLGAENAGDYWLANAVPQDSTTTFAIIFSTARIRQCLINMKICKGIHPAKQEIILIISLGTLIILLSVLIFDFQTAY